MLVKRLTKELERTKKQIMKLEKKRLNLLNKKHNIKVLLDIENMKEGKNNENLFNRLRTKF